jgi:hypothetical protein
MPRRREHLSAYLCICAPTKSQKNQEIIIRHHLKPSEKNVPAGSNAYLCICVFSKEITALGVMKYTHRLE